MFEIHSIGDATFLANVFEAVAMLTNSGAFLTLVAVGALIGLFVIAFNALVTGTREFNLHHLLIGIIAFLCMFGVHTKVTIEDAYTGQVRQVANVPIGPAFAGEIISSIGVDLTRVFEQAFSPSDRITEHPFADSLTILQSLHNVEADDSMLSILNKGLPNGNNLEESVRNYIADCTIPKLSFNLLTPSTLRNGTLKDLEFSSQIYHTKVPLSTVPSKSKLLSCAAAFPYIEKALNEATSPDKIQQNLMSKLNIANPMQSGGVMGAANQIDRLQNAVHSLLPVGVDQQKFMIAQAVLPALQKGNRDAHKTIGDVASAVMINQAIMQRNTQWAAEQSMFLTTVRPFLGFFEGFMYAITPFIAFALVIGMFGIQLVSKYCQLIIWIQLWYPIMSILNLYINTKAREAFSLVFQNLHGGYVTFNQIQETFRIVETDIATAGMLSAATPLIALFLVTGSSYAFTTLTNRMHGGDHIGRAPCITVQPL